MVFAEAEQCTENGMAKVNRELNRELNSELSSERNGKPNSEPNGGLYGGTYSTNRKYTGKLGTRKLSKAKEEKNRKHSVASTMLGESRGSRSARLAR